MDNNKKYHVVTYGCQMNEHESEKVEGMLAGMGYTKTSDIAKASVIAVNTCCVRDSAEQKIISNIGALKKYAAVNKDLKVIVCGCMSQQTKVAKKIFDRFRFVTIIMGTQNMFMIPQYLQQCIDMNTRIFAVEEDERDVHEGVAINRYKKPFAFVNVIYGCNNFCTYCIVPYVRGREKSRTPENILKEVKALAADGYKEIMLLGQNVNSYGHDLDEDITFAQLLTEICKIEGIKRIRFMTSHPKDLSDELIDVFKGDNPVCNHIHLPFQAGSDRVLKLMNRKYTRDDYLSKIEKIKKASPNIAITTDIIVGFPTETEEDFLDTLDIVKTVGYDSAFTFKYSKRSGTKACDMENQVSDEVKTDRIMRLIEVQNEITYDKNKAMVGKEVEVLVEGRREQNGQYFGKTDCFKTANFECDHDVVGEFIKLKITKAMKNSLFGEMI